ncbi:hypothetical protein Tco_0850554 [Tanacetum coccineum]
MVTVPIYQASSSVPPLLIPVIDLSPPKPTSSTTQAPIFIAITTTTPTTLPPPLQQQSTTESELTEHVTALEKKLFDLEQNNKNLDNTTQNLGSRAPLRDYFKDLSEEDMKEMLHQRMFRTGSYKSLLENIALYEVLEASMERVQRDKFLTEKDKSCSSKQQSGPHAEQPVEDIPIQDSDNISDLEDTNSAHLPKTKQRPEWLKPMSDDERPATPEPAWVIPTSHIPNAVNNGANALATTYQASAENSLLAKTENTRTNSSLIDTQLNQAIRADHQKYTIAEKDFKNLYPSDFEDLNLLLLQGHLNHLPGSDIRFEFKHDYTIIDSPRAVVFPVSNNEWKIMRFNEIYKFSDGALTNIMEALDYRVKGYKVNRLNLGMNTRFWTDKDVERSKEFIHVIERRHKTRRIFRNLECFVGGRVRDIDYKLLQRTK